MINEEREEIDEDEKMRRIKIIAPELYEEILDMEGEIERELADKMAVILIVKEFVLKYDVKAAQKLFNDLRKEMEKPSH